MALVVFQHADFENPARLGATLRDFGHQLRVIELHKGQPVPGDLDNVDGIVSLGGPMNVDEQDEHPWLAQEMELIAQAHSIEIPVVGICLGAQLIAKALGGKVAAMDEPEVGWAQIKEGFPGTIDPMLAGVPWMSWQFHLHSQQVTELPEDGTPLSGSKACKIQGFKVGLTTFGFQYHFEWSRADLKRVLEAHKTLIGKAGTTVDAINQASEQHFPIYRHLGDRLAGNLANLLFPIDKRVVSRPGEPVRNDAPAKS